ncbi:RdgB/HAM1 family non-canonical purine NTP pyrophosphatase [Aquifex pyrophilus]
MRILIASTNKGKIEEFRRILEPLGFEVVEPKEKIEVEERGETFLENACLKAKAYFERYGIPTLADDSGLIADAISPYPGIYSSRFYSIDFGGKEEVKTTKDEANIRKLLRLLKGKKERSAKFVVVLFFYGGDRGFFVEGEVRGRISEEPRGEKGFGYDPVFIPEGYDKTFGELTPEEKDRISHRGRAIRKFLEIIKGCEGVFT